MKARLKNKLRTRTHGLEHEMSESSYRGQMRKFKKTTQMLKRGVAPKSKIPVGVAKNCGFISYPAEKIASLFASCYRKTA